MKPVRVIFSSEAEEVYKYLNAEAARPKIVLEKRTFGTLIYPYVNSMTEVRVLFSSSPPKAT